MNRNSLYILGLLCLGAKSMVYGEISTQGLAQCGGLFLLDSETKKLSGTYCRIADSTQIDKYKATASLTHYQISGLWKDDWELSFKSNETIGSAGLAADFKNIGYSIAASSTPSLTASITAHTDHSGLYATALLERGSYELANIIWNSENEEDDVNHINALWKTEYIRKGMTIGANYKGNDFNAHLEQISTTPKNRTREYFAKDSTQIWIWNSRYAHQFKQSLLELSYTGASVDVNLFGNTYRDNSTKRFLYLPIEANLHYGDIRWETSLFGLEARGLKTDFHISKNHKRFFETLAPNRLLPTSLTQTLSFSFLQQNYLIDADLDIAAGTFGGHFSPTFNVTTHLSVTPKVEIHGYYTYDELGIDKTTEQTTFIAYKGYDESWFWTFESFGAITGLGFSLEKKFESIPNSLSLEWNAAQIIPFKTELHEHSKSDSEPASSQKKSAGSSSSGIFKNGFATHLGIAIQF